MKHYLLKFNFIVTIVMVTSLVFGCTKSDNKDKKNQNNILALAILASSGYADGELKFSASFNDKKLECGDEKYKMPTSNEEVQLRDFRFFVESVNFVKPDGSKLPLKMKKVDYWQLVEGETQLALIDFSEGPHGNHVHGKCIGTSDTEDTRTVIEGSIPQGSFSSVEVKIGVPEKWNHIDRDQQPSTSPLKSGTGLPWAWQAGYKFIRLELESASTTKRLLLHLGSTNCSGDPTIPFGQAGAVTCKNPYKPTLVLKPQGGFDPFKDTIDINTDEFFKGNGGVPASAFSSTTPLSCMPIGSGGGQNGTPATCGPILKNLGLVPGTQAGFSSSLVTEDGVGKVNLETQQPILRKK